MQCYNCNNIYNDYLGYCPYCGIKKEEFNVCSTCGEKLTIDISICPKCGGKPISETDEMKSDRLNKEGLKCDSRYASIHYFNEAIKFDKNNIGAWVNKSETLRDMTLCKANKCCDEALKFNKDNPKILLAKGRALKEDNIEEDANLILNNLLEMCDREIEKNESDENLWILKAEIFYTLSEYDKAIECYSAALEINPKNENSWIRKAFLYSLESNNACQIESYEKAIELNPINSKYYEKIGDIYKWSDENEKALEYYKKSLEINSNNKWLWETKGSLEEEMGLYVEAINSYTESNKLAPNNEGFLLSKAELLYKLNRFEDAIECYDEALKIHKHFNTYNLKAKALVNLELYEDAVEAYTKSIELYPDFGETYLLKGNLLKHLKRFEEEVECYDMCINEEDCSYEAHQKVKFLKGLALSKFDKEKSEKYFDELINECNLLLEIFPDHAEYWERKADLLYYSGNLEESLKYYDKVLTFDDVGNKGLILASKAKIFYDLKEYENAIKYLDEALEINTFSFALEIKGHCLEELNQYGEALECYKQCLEFNPENVEVISKKAELEKTLN